MSNKTKQEVVQIVVLPKSNHSDKFSYPISVEIGSKKNVDKILKAREKENEYASEDPCCFNGRSPDVVLTSLQTTGTYVVHVEIQGGLKFEACMSGENEIEYFPKSKSETRRQFMLIPSYDEKSEGKGSIVFTCNGKFLHRVTITGVPMKRPSKSQDDRVQGDNATYEGQGTACDRQRQYSDPGRTGPEVNTGQHVAHMSHSLSTMSMGSPAPRQGLPHSLSCPSTSAETDSTGRHIGPGSVRVLRDSYRHDEEEETSVKNFAEPVPPEPRPRFDLNESDGEYDQGSVDEDYIPQVSCAEKYKQLFSDGSLQTLAECLGPKDSFSVVIKLGVTYHEYESNKHNNPGNVAKADTNSFILWRNKTKESEGQKFKQLDSCLKEAGRNDVSAAIDRFLTSTDKLLKKSHFSQ